MDSTARMSASTFAVIGFCLIGAMATLARAQDRPAPADLLEISASASTEVAADVGVVIVTASRDGADVGALTQDVNDLLTRALADARAIPSVTASSGGYATQPHFDNAKRVGWTVHADLILKSHDFTALGKLVGKLTAVPNGLQISSSSFEVSPELRESQENDLMTQALAQFKTRATTAAKALGYSSWTLREVHVGNTTGEGNPPRPMPRMAMMSSMSAAPSAVPLEAARINLQLDVSGTVQMRH